MVCFKIAIHFVLTWFNVLSFRVGIKLHLASDVQKRSRYALHSFPPVASSRICNDEGKMMMVLRAS